MPRGATPGRNTPVRGAGARLRGAWVVNGAWWWTLHTVDPDGTIKLVGAILRGTPSLPGAACRGRHELFDEIPGQPNRRGVAEILAQRRTAAAALCSQCPVRARCPFS